MSEKEIIEIIEKLQCEYKEQQNDKKYNDYTVFKANEYSKGLQGLLDLYNKEKLNTLNLSEQLNKEKEKNKKIEDKIMEQDLMIIGLKENRRIAVEEIQEQYYVSKDKIKEIIHKIDVEDYYCLNEAEEDLRKLVE